MHSHWSEKLITFLTPCVAVVVIVVTVPQLPVSAVSSGGIAGRVAAADLLVDVNGYA